MTASTVTDTTAVTILTGDCREVLPTLPAESVQAVITSPPYWSLRDYGNPPSAWGGDPTCEHSWGKCPRAPWANAVPGPNGRVKNPLAGHVRPKDTGPFCQLCGAWYGCLGLEPTPELFVDHLVEVFRHVWRVLRDDGTLWLNLGDSYADGGKGGGGSFMAKRGDSSWAGRSTVTGWRSPPPGLKHKDLVGIPWMVAFALRADGWYLRSDIVWSKPNAMPEPARDRPAKSHEYLFLLTKRPTYYYNTNAVRESQTGNAHSRGHGITPKAAPGGNGRIRANASFYAATSRDVKVPGGRNRRSVWSIPTQRYSGAHYATFPERLVEPCLLAGSRPGDTVLDPFAGTGTVGRVAIRYHRSAVLIELNPESCRQAEVRTDGVQIEMSP